MYGKIENNKLILAGDRIQISNGWITKPSIQDLINLGYKPIEYSETPEYDDEEEKLITVYNNYQDKIVVSYEKITLTDEEHNEIIKTKILNEENKVTSRRQREADLNEGDGLGFIRLVNNNIKSLRKKLR